MRLDLEVIACSCVQVNDVVLIKGNKRTPEHFIGRMALVTSQCLNGW